MSGLRWIKIDTNVFNDTKIQLIENMPDGDAIIVIWFKLLALAGREFTNGVFVINDKVACTDEMLATVFRKKVGTVRLALQTFEDLNMVELLDGTYSITNWGKYQSADKYDHVKELARKRKQKQREKELFEASNDECHVTVTSQSRDVTPVDIDNRLKTKDKRLKIRDKEEDKEENPPRHRYGEYNNVLLTDKDMEKLKTEFPSDWEQRIERLAAYMASTGKSYKNHLATIRNWARMDKEKVAQKKAEEEKHFAGNDDPERIKQDEEMREFMKKMGWD